MTGRLPMRAGTVLHQSRVGAWVQERRGRSTRRDQKPTAASVADQIRRAHGKRRASLAGIAASTDGDHLAALSRPQRVFALQVLQGFGCEIKAKSSTLTTVIPEAEKDRALRDPIRQLCA